MAARVRKGSHEIRLTPSAVVTDINLNINLKNKSTACLPCGVGAVPAPQRLLVFRHRPVIIQPPELATRSSDPDIHRTNFDYSAPQPCPFLSVLLSCVTGSEINPTPLVLLGQGTHRVSAK